MNTIYYIKENDQYIEMTRDEYEAKLNNDPSFQKRRFMRCEGALLEVPEDVYETDEKEQQRIKYLERLDEKNDLISYDFWDTEFVQGRDLIPDRNVMSAEDAALNNIFTQKLKKSLQNLSEKDKAFIIALFSGMSEKKMAELIGVVPSTVHKRKKAILSTIKINFFKTF